MAEIPKAPCEPVQVGFDEDGEPFPEAPTRDPASGRINNEPNEGTYGSNAREISGFPIGPRRAGLCPAEMP